MDHSSKRLRRTATLFIGLVAVTVFTGCTQTYGRFIRDDQVDQAFKTGAFPQGLDYYYSGRSTKPYAIIGVGRNYNVPSGIWVAVEPGKLKKMSENMQGADGFNMLDHYGNVVGVWYSKLNNRSVKVDQQNHSIEVMFQNPSRH